MSDDLAMGTFDDICVKTWWIPQVGLWRTRVWSWSGDAVLFGLDAETHQHAVDNHKFAIAWAAKRGRA